MLTGIWEMRGDKSLLIQAGSALCQCHERFFYCIAYIYHEQVSLTVSLFSILAMPGFGAVFGNGIPIQQGELIL